MNHRYMDPCLRCTRQALVVLTETTRPTQPRQCPFNDPSSWQHLKLMAGPGTLHDLQGPARNSLDPVNQLTSVSSVSPDQLEARETTYQLVDDQLCPMSVLDIGRVDHNGQQQTHRVYHDVPLAPRHLLASVIATRPPFSVVLTDWLSMIAALGVGSLPSASLTFGLSVSWIRCHVPSRVHLRKYLYSVCHGGRSCGAIRQGHPVRRTYRIPFIISRGSTVRGLPPGLAGGIKAASSSHWASVKSLAYGLRVMHLSLIQV